MSDYLSLDEAAAKLGIPTERLVDLRSQGQVRGFRDGASWKFPESEIDRLADELADAGDEYNLRLEDSGIGLNSSGGSDVNLVPTEGEGSDVALVAGSDEGADPDSSDLPSGLEVGDLLEIDSAELQLDDPALMHDSGMLDLAIEPKEGSTGPVGKGSGASASRPPSSADSDLGLSEALLDDDEDSDELVLGDDDSSSMNVLGSDLDLAGSDVASGKASSLELLDELNSPSDENESGLLKSSGADVLSELDLLGVEQGGSGLISGDSEDLLQSSGIGDSALGSNDDALDDDDDLVISDGDDDLVIDSHGSDISIAGDSGINLMSPSDSGLSLESEPLDLAGSSISSLDLGAELGGDGSDVGSDPGGSGIDFEGDEEFQLSPSGVGLDADDSGSQVIEVEDSEAIAEAVDFGDAGGFGDDGFGDDGGAFAAEEEALDEAVEFDESDADVKRVGAASAYEIPFTTFQCVGLAMIMVVLAFGGMLMTDLVRNMWAYSEPSAPVSSLTTALIDLMGW